MFHYDYPTDTWSETDRTPVELDDWDVDLWGYAPDWDDYVPQRDLPDGWDRVYGYSTKSFGHTPILHDSETFEGRPQANIAAWARYRKQSCTVVTLPVMWEPDDPESNHYVLEGWVMLIKWDGD